MCAQQEAYSERKEAAKPGASPPQGAAVGPSGAQPAAAAPAAPAASTAQAEITPEMSWRGASNRGGESCMRMLVDLQGG